MVRLLLLLVTVQPAMPLGLSSWSGASSTLTIGDLLCNEEEPDIFGPPSPGRPSDDALKGLFLGKGSGVAGYLSNWSLAPLKDIGVHTSTVSSTWSSEGVSSVIGRARLASGSVDDAANMVEPDEDRVVRTDCGLLLGGWGALLFLKPSDVTDPTEVQDMTLMSSFRTEVDKLVMETVLKGGVVGSLRPTPPPLPLEPPLQ